MRNQLEPEEGRMEQNIQKNLLIDISLLSFNLRLGKKRKQRNYIICIQSVGKEKKRSELSYE